MAGRVPALAVPNVWLGVSVENQRFAHRCEQLLAVPAARYFVSAEPLLGPLDLTLYLGRTLISWVIAVGESGPRHLPIGISWARFLASQCRARRAVFFLQPLSA